MAIEFNSKNAKRWARLGERPMFGMSVLELAKENENIIAVVADVVSSAGLSRMKEELPEQIIDVGIAEQNMMGIAAGLASEGYDVLTATFAPFQSMRCLEQIRVNLGYMGMKVTMAGLASGMAYGELGFTHCCIEDSAILRSIPNIAVVIPADCMEVGKAVETAIKYPKSVYIRLMNKTNIPIVYTDDYTFEIGKANVLTQGDDIAIIAAGTMVSQSLKAAEFLKDHGVYATVVNMHTLKPLDTEVLSNLIKANYKLIVTVEEHNIIGGLGSATAEYLVTQKNIPPVMMIGINDFYPHAGSYEYLLEKNGLSAEQIAERIKSKLNA